MPNVVLFVTTYCYVFAIGFPAFRCLPAWSRNQSAFIFLPPFLGFLTLSFLSSFAVRYGKSIDLIGTFGTALVVIGALSAIQFCYKAMSARRHLTRQLPGRKFVISFVLQVTLGLVSILTVLSFGLNTEGRLSTSYLTGVDVAGYSATAQYLRTWSGYRQLEVDLSKEVGLASSDEAKASNFLALNLQIEIASEFVLKAYRWSYPAILASLSNTLEVDSVYRLNYIMLAICFGALFSFVTVFASMFCDANLIAPLVGFCVGINCNLLAITAQGQFAQVMSAPVFLFLLAAIFRHREARLHNQFRLQTKDFVLFIFMTASLMPLYNEMVFTVFIFLALLTFFDFLSGQAQFARATYL